MFTLNQLTHIADAIELSRRSTTRAKNTKTNPEFAPIYDKILMDLNDIDKIIKTEWAKLSKTK